MCNLELICRIGLLILGILQASFVSAQVSDKNIYPLKVSPLLSGSFGELRATHFHGGVDFRTGGNVGLPVVCVSDGVVCRIKISSVGYGNALYVEHDDGTTTVYGHLLRYNKRITALVRELQYRQESFELDEDTKGYGLFFRKGDTIAFSGNTGSSGGPHLHFEYRNTKTEHTLNPLLWYRVEDRIPPRIKALYLYGISEGGCVEMIRKGNLKLLGNARYSGGRIIVPSGRIGVGVFVSDAMNNSQSSLGIYKMTLRVNRDEVFYLKVDSCSFNQAGLINELKDYRLYNTSRETVYRTFGNYLNRLLGVRIKNKGYIELSKGSEADVEMVVADINGNISTLTFTLVGGNPDQSRNRKILSYDKSHLLQAGEYTLKLDTGSLLSSVYGEAEIDTLMDAGGKKYRVFVASATDEPLMNKVRLHVGGDYSDKMLICRVDDKLRKSVFTTLRDSAGIYCYTNILGKYMLAEDVVAPSITYLGAIGGEIRFRLGDNLSGVSRYRLEVNGKWCLFVYDAKSRILSCRISEPVFEKGKNNRVKLIVWDAVGNEAQTEISVKG